MTDEAVTLAKNMPSKLVQEITPVYDAVVETIAIRTVLQMHLGIPRTLSHSLIIYLLIINLNLSTTRVWSNYDNYTASHLHWVEQSYFILSHKHTYNAIVFFFLFVLCFDNINILFSFLI